MGEPEPDRRQSTHTPRRTTPVSKRTPSPSPRQTTTGRPQPHRSRSSSRMRSPHRSPGSPRDNTSQPAPRYPSQLSSRQNQLLQRQPAMYGTGTTARQPPGHLQPTRSRFRAITRLHSPSKTTTGDRTHQRSPFTSGTLRTPRKYPPPASGHTASGSPSPRPTHNPYPRG